MDPDMCRWDISERSFIGIHNTLYAGSDNWSYDLKWGRLMGKFVNTFSPKFKAKAHVERPQIPQK